MVVLGTGSDDGNDGYDDGVGPEGGLRIFRSFVFRSLGLLDFFCGVECMLHNIDIVLDFHVSLALEKAARICVCN